MISFTVHSIPVAQPRQRHRIVTGSGRQFVSNYTPVKDPVNTFKAACQWSAAQAYRGAPLDCPIKIKIVAVFPRPKNMMWKSKPMPRCHKTSKPDFDNIAKSVCDALTGLLWRDDALIVDAHVVKLIACGTEQPKVEIEVEKNESSVYPAVAIRAWRNKKNRVEAQEFTGTKTRLHCTRQRAENLENATECGT